MEAVDFAKKALEIGKKLYTQKKTDSVYLHFIVKYYLKHMPLS